MPTQARKTTPMKTSTAAVSARREVRAEKSKVPALTVQFRGDKFDIPRDRLGSARVILRQKHMEQFGVTLDSLSELLFEILGKSDSERFINLCKPGDTLLETTNEFMREMNKAANVPNS